MASIDILPPKFEMVRDATLTGSIDPTERSAVQCRECQMMLRKSLLNTHQCIQDSEQFKGITFKKKPNNMYVCPMCNRQLYKMQIDSHLATHPLELIQKIIERQSHKPERIAPPPPMILKSNEDFSKRDQGSLKESEGAKRGGEGMKSAALRPLQAIGDPRITSMLSDSKATASHQSPAKSPLSLAATPSKIGTCSILQHQGQPKTSSLPSPSVVSVLPTSPQAKSTDSQIISAVPPPPSPKPSSPTTLPILPQINHQPDQQVHVTSEVQSSSPAPSPANGQSPTIMSVAFESVIIPMKRPREFTVKECIRKVRKTEFGFARLEEINRRCRVLTMKRYYRRLKRLLGA